MYDLTLKFKTGYIKVEVNLKKLPRGYLKFCLGLGFLLIRLDRWMDISL